MQTIDLETTTTTHFGAVNFDGANEVSVWIDGQPEVFMTFQQAEELSDALLHLIAEHATSHLYGGDE